MEEKSVNSLREEVSEMRQASLQMSQLTEEQKNQALRALADLLSEKKSEILQANSIDQQKSREKISSSLFQRLILNEKKLNDLAQGVKDLVLLPDPVGKVLSRRELQADLTLTQVSVPLGVIGIVFEARPEAMVQILSLVLKSGNAAILKGGKEASQSNQRIHELFEELTRRCDFLPRHWHGLVSSREEVHELLALDDLIDLMIPRGSNQLVQSVMNSTKIPVLGHADGICHIYLDEGYPVERALPVILNAKTQYPAACNAVETLLVHQKNAGKFLPRFLEECKKQSIQVYGDESFKQYQEDIVEPSSWSVEYGELALAVKLVTDVDEAITHINRYGSHHTDAILSENSENQQKFLAGVDSASVFVNVSTRFADGYRFGLGAEVGISTSKTHARGPVGLEGLVTYKFLLRGSGQLVE